MRIRVLTISLILAVTACGAPDDDLDALGAMTGGYDVVELLRNDALLIGAYDDEASTCFAYRASTRAGVHCMRALGAGGWAVETFLAGSGEASAVLIGADPAVAEVRVPMRAGGHQTVRPRRVEGVQQLVEVLMVDPATVDLTGNGVTAYDAAGVLLGRTHDCAGLGGTPDCGPYDGVFDKRIEPP